MTEPDLHTIAAQRLSGAKLRYTGSRRALVEVLITADRPLMLPQILSLDPSLTQSSAYRNLAELIGAGVVHRIVTAEEHAHFELAEDLTEHHHHLICTVCGAVTDFTVPAALEAQLDDALGREAATHGFVADHHRLDLVGRCDSCIA